MARLSAEERETIVCFDDAGEECVVCTASPRVAERLRRAGLEPEPAGPGASWRFRLPKRAVRIKIGGRSVPLAGRGRAEKAAQG